jgi:hypothetical protein
MANKTVKASNGVNLVVNSTGEVVEAYTKENNIPNNLPSNDAKVTTAVTNLNNSPSLKRALSIPNVTVTISENYSPTGTKGTTEAITSSKIPATTSNEFKPPDNYGPVLTGAGGATKALVYPLDLSNDQDRMVIIMYRYRNTLNNLFGKRDISKVSEGDGKPLSYIVLPIPNNLGDISKVGWAPSTLSVAEIVNATTNTAVSAIPGASKGIENLKSSITDAVSKVASDPNLSRFSGTITNPNQDLLFQSNGLREFTYSFDLFPRNEAESKEIRNIVRVFRQGMLPRKIGIGGLLVGAPNVFRIRFLKGGSNEPLKDIRRHKELALTSFVADPTPGDIWMTHNDADHSTVGFKILMQFTELVPIYYDDFVDSEGKSVKDINDDPISDDSIGY